MSEKRSAQRESRTMKAIINARVVFPDRVVDGGGILFDEDGILASGRIKVPEGVETVDARGMYVGPGLVDEHLHGYQQYGEAFNVVDACREVAKAHLKHGTTTMTPSAAYNLSREDFLSVISQCNQAIREGGTTIAGVHFEGPFTNPRYGSKAERAWQYSDAVCREIFDRAGRNVLHCTYAPEMECAPSLEALLAERGVIADIGHTCAGPADMERAVSRGARIITHTFDAMGHYLGAQEAAKETGDVQDSTSQVALATPGLYYELICDSMGAHVTKYSASLAYRAAGEDYIILITDATCYRKANAPSGTCERWRDATDINFNERGQLSGSRLTLNRACVNFMKMTGADIRVAFKCASTNPARALRLDNRVGSVEVGKEANLLMVDDDFCVRAVWFRGKPVDEVRN